jgi:hypothetical protein
MKSTLIFFFLAALMQGAAAHHLDDYDARMRAEARLPDDWFVCKKTEDCALVSVPCRSGLAVNAAHVDAARDALIEAFPFCLGSTLSDTEAACEKRQCVTEPAKDN